MRPGGVAFVEDRAVGKKRHAHAVFFDEHGRTRLGEIAPGEQALRPGTTVLAGNRDADAAIRAAFGAEAESAQAAVVKTVLDGFGEKIEEGDTTSSFATFAGAVQNTDFTVATNAYTSTANGQNVWKFGVDTRGRKRYLRVSASPQTTMVIGAVATLSRGGKMPSSASEAGSLNAVYV